MFFFISNVASKEVKFEASSTDVAGPGSDPHRSTGRPPGSGPRCEK